jgi:hypothetical protein
VSIVSSFPLQINSFFVTVEVKFVINGIVVVIVVGIVCVAGTLVGQSG